MAPAHVARLGAEEVVLAWAQFDTLRLMLIKVAARVTELATRIKVALPSSYPYRGSLTLLASRAARPP